MSENNSNLSFEEFKEQLEKARNAGNDPNTEIKSEATPMPENQIEFSELQPAAEEPTSAPDFASLSSN